MLEYYTACRQRTPLKTVQGQQDWSTYGELEK